MVETLLSVFPNPNDLIAIDPEDLAGILLEIIPGIMQNSKFNLNGLEAQLFHVIVGALPVGRDDLLARQHGGRQCQKQ
jgi:hypothetical protein